MRIRLNRLGRAWAVVAMLGCGGGSTATQPPAKSGGDAAAKPAAAKGLDVGAMFARENEAGPLQEVKAPNGSFKSRIEAAAVPTVTAGDGFVAVTVGLADSQVQCFVYPEGKDGGEVVRLLAVATLEENIAEDRRSWVDVHGDQIDGWPYAIGRAHYLVDTPNGKMAGDFKVAISVRDETTIACIMDGPGYYASFERVVRSLLAPMDSASNRASAPRYTEIIRSGVAGRLVSISRVTVEADGTKRSAGIDLMITPTGTLKTSDDISVERSANGRITGGVYAKGSMGQMDHQLELTSKGDRYHVSGTVQDKPVTFDFTVQGGIPDDDRSKAAICGVRDGKLPSAELAGYLPGVDPQQASTVRIEKSQTPDAHVLLTFGASSGMTLKAHTDEDCDMDRGMASTAGITFPIERLWVHGKQP